MWNPINGIDKNSVSHLKMGRGKKRDSIFTVGLSNQNAPTIKIGASERKYIMRVEKIVNEAYWPLSGLGCIAP